MAGCCPGSKRFPSIKTMVGDLTGTIVQAIGHAARTGEVVAPEYIIRSRLEICKKCDQKSGVRCLQCGCFISLKAAVSVAQCPKNKWP